MIMAPLESHASVSDRVAAATHLLIGLDYDGTLTPIVDNPANAWIDSDLRTSLRRLSRFPSATVAIAGGRALNDLSMRVGLPDLFYVANHGLQITGPGIEFVDPTAAQAKEALKHIALRLLAELSCIAGIQIEDKTLSLGIHYRRVHPDKRILIGPIIVSALREWDDRFVVTGGNHVWEVRPKVDWSKGAAIRWIKDRIAKPDTVVVYVGDDETDEVAFRAFPEDVTIKVGACRDTAARYQVGGTADVKRLLQSFITILSPRS